MQRFYFVGLDTGISRVHAEVLIGNYESEDPHEFCVQWTSCGSDLFKPEILPILVAYDDSWKFIYEHNQDVLEMMARHDNEEISLQSFCEELEKLGIRMLAQT